eukprot:TRINITY_DN2075_c0_g1_i1.p1 TRINITY_DN2075_c0_g1~~TRINITY_DN2075_c0_g1_i1.p1  ORF type:complete len:472 (-),score=103.97 TRINITY_DN2075_c0_g1_i1:458-1873(-)
MEESMIHTGQITDSEKEEKKEKKENLSKAISFEKMKGLGCLGYCPDSPTLCVKITNIIDRFFLTKQPKKLFFNITWSISRQNYQTLPIRRGKEMIFDCYTFFADDLSGDLLIGMYISKKGKKKKIGEASFDLTVLTPNSEPVGVMLPISFTDPVFHEKQLKDPSRTYVVEMDVAFCDPVLLECDISEEEVEIKEGFYDVYELGDLIGEGTYATVRKGMHKKTGELFAVKIIDTSQYEELQLEHLKREIEITTKLKSEFIINMIEHYSEDDCIYLVLEYAPGGELFDLVVERRHLSEYEAIVLIKQIMQAVHYIHSKGIAHRDLKLENILVVDKQRLKIKISDFGLSKDFMKSSLSTSCGTPEYVAPEVILSEPYDEAADIWSIGVITYILLCGQTPFGGGSTNEIFARVLALDYAFSHPIWNLISSQAKQFISCLLLRDPESRPTARQCLHSPWLRRFDRKKGRRRPSNSS